VAQLVRARLDRGVVTVSVRDEGGGGPLHVRADLAAARAYAAALEEVRRTLNLPQPVTLELVAAQPGVLAVGERAEDPDALFAALRPGIEEALSGLLEMRGREGAALRRELEGRIDEVERLAAALRRLASDAPELFRARLRERLERALRPGELDAQRLTQEVAILADRADVSEELTRLDAHLAELKRLVADAAPAGRRLEFLTQELHRELNTIGSKSQSAQVSARVVEAKAELERVREQIQNVE
jgi:uncharacterized protein (TIGR00255 family)